MADISNKQPLVPHFVTLEAQGGAAGFGRRRGSVVYAEEDGTCVREVADEFIGDCAAEVEKVDAALGAVGVGEEGEGGEEGRVG